MLIISVGIAATLVSFFSLTEFPKWLDFKPFNCIVCLTFWCCIITQLCNLQFIAEPIAYAGIGAYLVIVLKRILFKI